MDPLIQINFHIVIEGLISVDCKPITALIQYRIKKVTNYSCQKPKVKFSIDMAKSPGKQ